MTYKATTNDTLFTKLTVEGFTGRERATPGNVGVCLSGGGSRALSAGMGQLRALNHLKLPSGGPSLLSQVKALSTVSGGSWLAVNFEYLADETKDADFLNRYVADPHDLVPSNGPSVGVTLDKLPPGNIGTPVTSVLFSVPALAVEAYLLWKFVGTPADMLWQVLIGVHILGEHDLYSPSKNALPTSLFSWDGTTLRNDVVGPNPELVDETAHLVASGAGRASRPFIVCNTAMFVKEGKTTLLAPVQATPFFTGIVGALDALDADGRKVGGGGVTSFAFNSALYGVSGSNVTVAQARQWSLTDIVGSSSAAFAGPLQQILNDHVLLETYIKQFAGDIWELLKERLPSAAFASTDENRVKAFLQAPALEEIMADIGRLDPSAVIPAYDYWPVVDAVPNPKPKTSRFADGGNLENTGVASLLAYRDIDSVIAFVNSATPMARGQKGVVDPKTGKEVPDTAIIVDSQLPPLFGFQPYDPDRGYVAFGQGMASSDIFKSKSKVFPTEAFADLLQGLWNNSGKGSFARPANFTQRLETVANDWFGVSQRPVTVLWVYTNAVGDWFAKLRPDVQALVSANGDFPHYGTFDTNLSETEINLLASLTSWCVGDDSNSQPFIDLFK